MLIPINNRNVTTMPATVELMAMIVSGVGKFEESTMSEEPTMDEEVGEEPTMDEEVGEEPTIVVNIVRDGVLTLASLVISDKTQQLL